MKTPLIHGIALLAFATAGAQAQMPAALQAVGYTAPTAPLPVAPGQVVTLFLRDISTLPGGQLRSGEAGPGTLPSTVAGISASISQPPMTVPLFAVRQENDCDPAASLNPACILTSIKVQIPFEIASTTQLVVAVDGQVSRGFPLQAIADNSHVWTTCDASWDTAPTSTCDRVIYHADGTRVTAASPAVPGEALTVRAYGLGQTSPRAETGQTSPMGTSLTELSPGVPRVRLRFLNMPLNAPSSLPRTFIADDVNDRNTAVATGGLIPGIVGLYQIKVPLPQSFAPVLPCGPDVHANAIVDVITSQGSEQVSFCVKP